MKLNLYELCGTKQNKGSLKVILNGNLKRKIGLATYELKRRKLKLKYLAYKVGIDYTTLWKHLNNNDVIPLILLRELEGLTHVSFQEEVTHFYLPHSKYKIKAPKKLNETMAKLIGCIIADGHLKTRESNRGKHYVLVIREGHKSNAEAAIEWFRDVFEVNLNLNKGKNHYYIYISNKVIHNYFTKIIGLPEGKKAGIISTPDHICSSSALVKKAYLQGLFMFDGGVDYRTGYVNYISKSKKLIEEMVLLLNGIGLEPDYISLLPDRYGRYKLRFRKRKKLEKCLNLFQKESEKWWRLNEHLYGLEGITKDLKMLVKSFDIYYPKVRSNVITFSDVINAIYLLDKKANMINLSKQLKRNKTVIYEFLKQLEYWEIITSHRVALKKHYCFKKILKIPRRH